jgi:hypothetical protein
MMLYVYYSIICLRVGFEDFHARVRDIANVHGYEAYNQTYHRDKHCDSELFPSRIPLFVAVYVLQNHQNAILKNVMYAILKKATGIASEE